MAVLGGWLCFAWLCAPAQRVQADSRGLLSVEATGGINTPVGLVGLRLGLSPLPWVVVDGGAGLGLRGVQLAASGRLQIPLSRDSGADSYLGWGSGVSQGDYSESNGGLAHAVGGAVAEIVTLGLLQGHDIYWRDVTWWNNELYLAGHLEELFGRLYLGVALPISPGRCYIRSEGVQDWEPCAADNSYRLEGEVLRPRFDTDFLLYAGISLGVFIL